MAAHAPNIAAGALGRAQALPAVQLAAEGEPQPFRLARSRPPLTNEMACQMVFVHAAWGDAPHGSTQSSRGYFPAAGLLRSRSQTHYSICEAIDDA